MTKLNSTPSKPRKATQSPDGGLPTLYAAWLKADAENDTAAYVKLQDRIMKAEPTSVRDLAIQFVVESDDGVSEFRHEWLEQVRRLADGAAGARPTEIRGNSKQLGHSSVSIRADEVSELSYRDLEVLHDAMYIAFRVVSGITNQPNMRLDDDNFTPTGRIIERIADLLAGVLEMAVTASRTQPGEAASDVYEAQCRAKALLQYHANSFDQMDDVFVIAADANAAIERARFLSRHEGAKS